jgi:hypothetical protein
MNDAKEVVTAATPTKAWNPATVYGSSVTATFNPRVVPIAEAAPNKIMACINTGALKLREARAVTTPPSTPIIPKAAPTLALF